MKKVAIHQTRLTTLNGQEQDRNLRDIASPFDDALKGLGASQGKKKIKKKSIRTMEKISE